MKIKGHSLMHIRIYGGINVNSDLFSLAAPFFPTQSDDQLTVNFQNKFLTTNFLTLTKYYIFVKNYGQGKQNSQGQA